MKKIKSEKGITLVALIITIIVLLILAVVAIRAVQGDGILQYAETGKSKYTEAQEKEKVALASSQAFLAGTGKVTEDSLTAAMNSEFGEDWELVSETEASYTVQIKSSERKYIISTNGKMEENKVIEISDTSYFNYANYNQSDLPVGRYVTGLSNDGKAKLTSLAGKKVKLIIPEKDGDNDIIGISAGAFKNNEILNNLGNLSVDASTVTIMISETFKGCTTLTSIDTQNLTSIGLSAFEGCTSLNSINTEKVTEISNFAFYGCTNLSSIDLSSVTSIGNKAFGETGLIKVEIPSTVITMGSMIFYSSTSLTDIYVPGLTAKPSSWTASWAAGFSTIIRWNTAMPTE